MQNHANHAGMACSFMKGSDRNSRTAVKGGDDIMKGSAAMWPANERQKKAAISIVESQRKAEKSVAQSSGFLNKGWKGGPSGVF